MDTDPIYIWTKIIAIVSCLKCSTKVYSMREVSEFSREWIIEKKNLKKLEVLCFRFLDHDTITYWHDGCNLNLSSTHWCYKCINPGHHVGKMSDSINAHIVNQQLFFHVCWVKMSGCLVDIRVHRSPNLHTTFKHFLQSLMALLVTFPGRRLVRWWRSWMFVHGQWWWVLVFDF